MKKFMALATIFLLNTSTTMAMNQNPLSKVILDRDDGDTLTKFFEDDASHEQINAEILVGAFREVVMLEKINLINALLNIPHIRTLIVCHQEIGPSFVDACREKKIQSVICLLNNPHSQKRLVNDILMQALDGNCCNEIRGLITAQIAALK